MSSGDKITLNVQTKIFGGIGTDTSVIVKRDALTDSLIVNPITIDPSNIDSVTNQITINSHKLETGQKVSYAASLPASGLSTGSYYVYRINDNIIQLSETYINSTSNPPNVVSIANTGGGTQTISPINPKIEIVKNNSLVFDLSDSSLNGYLLKIYCDNQFNNEFEGFNPKNLNGFGWFIGYNPSEIVRLRFAFGMGDQIGYNLENLAVGDELNFILSRKLLFGGEWSLGYVLYWDGSDNPLDFSYLMISFIL